jgi:hypothetical protein
MINKIEWEVNDRSDLINLLIDIPELGTEVKRRQILESADLSTFISKINLSGDTTTVVGEMVTYLSQYGLIDEAKTALGLFLTAIHNITGYEQKLFIDQLLKKYQLNASKIERNHYKRVDELLKPYYFDLNELIKRCLDEVVDKKGLVGLAVPYDENPFPQYFCQRLKDRLDKKQIYDRDVVTLDYRNPVDRVVKIIKEYKEKLLKKGIVICPVRVDLSGMNSIAEFWQKISNEFTEIEHSLILVIVSSEPILLENQNLIKLDSPRFTKADVHEWVLDVTRALEWGEEEKEVKEKWKKKIIGEDIQTEPLDIRSVYDNLRYTIEILQENLQQKLTPKDFLNALD